MTPLTIRSLDPSSPLATAYGCDSIAWWLEDSVIVVAFIRSATLA
jgi:hypothetical protein